MKRIKYISLLIAIFLSLSLNCYGSISYSNSVNISDLSVENVTIGSETFVSLSYPQYEAFYDSIGNPILPCKYLKFSIPYNAVNVTVNYSLGPVSYSSLNQKVTPAQLPVIDGDEAFELQYDSIKYSINSYYPDSIVKIVDDGFFFGDNRVITVRVSPFMYNPVLNRLKITQNINFTISYSLDNSSSNVPYNSLSRGNEYLRQAERKYVQSIVQNPGNVVSNHIPRQKIRRIYNPTPDTTFYPIFDPEDAIADSIYTLYRDTIYNNDDYQAFFKMPSYNYVIFTSKSLAPAFKRLIALKRQKGYSAGVINTKTLLHNCYYNGGDSSYVDLSPFTSYWDVIQDSAGIIRQYLKVAYQDEKNPVQYVLMGGKAESAPIRFGSYYDYSPDTIISYFAKTTTDFYYSNLKNNWHTNHQHEIGNLLGFTIYSFSKKLYDLDFSPDLFVGRLLCNTIEDVNNYTDKLICYELNPGQGDFSYLSRALYTEERDNKSYGNANAMRQILQNNVNVTTNVISLQSEDYPTGEDIINDINSTKYGFISFLSHGEPGLMVVNNSKKTQLHVIDSQDTIMVSRFGNSYLNESNNGFDCIHNRFQPFIGYSIGCTTMPFNTYIDPKDNNKLWDVDTNVGASLTTGGKYGCAAYLGNTNVGFISSVQKQSSNMLETYFYRALSLNPKVGVAEALSKAIVPNKGNWIKHINFSHNLLGDPEFEVWTDTPQYFSNISVTRTNNSISVNGINSGDSTIVAYCDNTTQGKAYASSSSISFNGISPNSCIMVYKHNYIPYIAPLVLQNYEITKSQYVFASSISIGRNFDQNRTQGNVIFRKGVLYEVEANDNVYLGDGLIIEPDAKLKITTPKTVYITGGSISNGASLDIEAGNIVIEKNYSVEKGGIVTLDKYSGNVDYRIVKH